MIRHASGVLDYVGDEVGLRGRERWLLSVHEDGSRTLRAHCEMWDTRLERDVVHTVSASYRPLRSFITQRIDGRFLGEGWFHFGAAEIVGRGVLDESGPLEQRVRLDAEPQFFIPHAVCCDAWIVPPYDSETSGALPLTAGWRASPMANGSTGPRAEPMAPVRISLLGEEQVRVPAGTFDTLHFAVEQGGGLRDDLWTTADDYLLVQLRSDVLRSWYRLSELTVAVGEALAPPSVGR